MFVNDLKDCLESKGVEGATVGDLKLCLILYADDSRLISTNYIVLLLSLVTLILKYFSICLNLQYGLHFKCHFRSYHILREKENPNINRHNNPIA